MTGAPKPDVVEKRELHAFGRAEPRTVAEHQRVLAYIVAILLYPIDIT